MPLPDDPEALDAWQARARALIGDATLTPPQVADAAGVSLPEVRRLWRALGFPPVPDDASFFTTADVDAARGAHALVTSGALEPELLIQLTRAAGQAMAHLAEAQIASVGERIQRLAAEPDVDRDELLWGVTGALLATFEPFLTYIWRRHLLSVAWNHTAATADAARASGDLVIGFADMVGFTAISQQLDERELAGMVDRFEERVYDHVPERRGRVVKMIGDEVMFSVERPADAAEIALSLVDAHRADEALPDLRVGLALGPTLSWQGDLFGPTVNLASRVVNVARAGTVLVSPTLAQALRGHPAYVLRELRGLNLRGIGRVRLHALRRAAA